MTPARDWSKIKKKTTSTVFNFFFERDQLEIMDVDRTVSPLSPASTNDAEFLYIAVCRRKKETRKTNFHLVFTVEKLCNINQRIVKVSLLPAYTQRRVNRMGETYLNKVEEAGDLGRS
jgi:hypothetical protein